MSLRIFACHMNFLSKYLVIKLLAIITRFFVGFIKMPALLKISVLRNYILFFVAVVVVLFIINLDCGLLSSF